MESHIQKRSHRIGGYLRKLASDAVTCGTRQRYQQATDAGEKRYTPNVAKRHAV